MSGVVAAFVVEEAGSVDVVAAHAAQEEVVTKEARRLAEIGVAGGVGDLMQFTRGDRKAGLLQQLACGGLMKVFAVLEPASRREPRISS